jgi:hypothetical protein
MTGTGVRPRNLPKPTLVAASSAIFWRAASAAAAAAAAASAAFLFAASTAEACMERASLRCGS